jgi:hypothetical protein
MTGPRNATTTNRGRTYTWPATNETFTSVTTILGRGVPKPALKPWGEKMVATAAVEKAAIWSQMGDDEAIDWLKRAPFRDTEKAAAQGTDIHNWAEKFALGGHGVTLEAAPEAQRGYLDGFLHFVGEMKPTWEMSEASVYNREHGYAGTLDALLTLDPEIGATLGLEGLGLVDYKTTRSGIFPEVALQLAAYRYAEFIGMPDGTEIPMREVNWCAGLWLKPTGYELIPIDAGPLAFEYFLSACTIADFADTVGKQLVGRPAQLPAQPKRMGKQSDGVTPARPNIPALVD